MNEFRSTRLTRVEKKQERTQVELREIEGEKEWHKHLDEVKQVTGGQRKQEKQSSRGGEERWKHAGKNMGTEEEGQRKGEGQKKTVEQRSLKILGDSMLKYISASELLPNGINSENLCKRGATIENLIADLQKGETDDSVSDVLIHIGSNNLPTGNATSVMNSIGKTLHLAQKKYTNAQIHYSPIIPKYDNSNIPVCDKINNAIEKLCKSNHYSFIKTRSLFVNHKGIKFERLSRYDSLHLNRKGIVAIGKHLKYYMNSRNDLIVRAPPPYSPSRP